MRRRGLAPVLPSVFVVAVFCFTLQAVPAASGVPGVTGSHPGGIGPMEATGENPVAVVLGTFNADGHLDVATVNRDSDSVSVLMGKGDGTLEAAVDVPVGGAPNSLAVGDLNEDGHADLAVTIGLHGVSILLNDGEGGFENTLQDPFPCTYPPGCGSAAAALEDVDKDNHLDMIVGFSDYYLEPSPKTSAVRVERAAAPRTTQTML